MRHLIKNYGAAIVGTGAVAFAIGYSLVTCDTASFISGFASGVGALVAFILWID